MTDSHKGAISVCIARTKESKYFSKKQVESEDIRLHQSFLNILERNTCCDSEGYMKLVGDKLVREGREFC